MGNSLLLWYREKCKFRWKTAFFSTLIIGLLTHFYKLTNNLPCHDSLVNGYASQNIVGSGRWFLSVACSLSSYFDLPWVTGLFSIVFIALTMAVVAEIFEMENPVLIAVCSGLFVSYPAVFNTLYYSYTADGYMLAMLFAAVGVYLLRFGQKRKLCFAAAGILFCLSCGIYQAYVSFALVLAITYLIKELLEKERKGREILLWIISRLAVVAVSLGLYFIIWKICISVQGVTATDYQGVGQVGLPGPAQIVKAIVSLGKRFALVMLGGDIFEEGISIYTVINAVFFMCFIPGFFVAAKKSGIFRKKANTIILLLCPVAILLCAFMWIFVSESIVYHVLMLQSLSLIYILAAYLFDRWLKPRVSTLFAAVIVALTVNFAVLANTGYFLLDRTYEKSYAQAVEMSARINNLVGSEDAQVSRIAVLGYVPNEFSAKPENSIHLVNHMIENTLMYDHKHTTAFLENYTSLKLDAVDEETLELLADNPDIAGMGNWPEADSVRIIGDTVVVKLSDQSQQSK